MHDDDITNAVEHATHDACADQSEDWEAPDMGVLSLRRRDPPEFPVNVLGKSWSRWVTDAAYVTATPVDYVAMPLLACASALIGNARWAQATPLWIEPPHLWIGTVGDSGHGKSPGADPFMRTIMPQLEQEMRKDFPEQLRGWQAAQKIYRAKEKRWQREAQKGSDHDQIPPPPTDELETPRPQEPRLVISDVTIERVAASLATASPKGLLILRDELAGWLQGLNNYNDAGRAFYVEAWGGKPYTVERQTGAIHVPRLVVSVYGTTQPDKITMLMQGADDGLLSRFL